MKDTYTLYKMLYNKVEKLSKYRDIYLCKYTEDNKEVTKIFIDDGTDYYDGYKVKNYHTGKQLVAFLLMDETTEETIFVVHNKRTFEKVIEIRSTNIGIYESSKMVIDSLIVQFTIFYTDKISRNHKSMVLIFNNNTGILTYIITDISSISNNPNKRRQNLLVEYMIHEHSDVYLTHKGIISNEGANISIRFIPETVVKSTKVGENIILKE